MKLGNVCSTSQPSRTILDARSLRDTAIARGIPIMTQIRIAVVIM